MQVESWPTDRPIPYARNARRIGEVAVDTVATSIKDGWRQPIVVDELGVVIAGHTRLLAAKKLCLAQVPVHRASGLTPAQVKAYRLMDNRSHEKAKCALELLPLQLADLRLLESGFDEDELARLMTPATFGGHTEPTSKLGDVWLLGSHLLEVAQ